MQHVRALETLQQPDKRISQWQSPMYSVQEATVWVLPAETAAGSLWMEARHLWARH